jgi:hypothetical protein
MKLDIDLGVMDWRAQGVYTELYFEVGLYLIPVFHIGLALPVKIDLAGFAVEAQGEMGFPDVEGPEETDAEKNCGWNYYIEDCFESPLFEQYTRYVKMCFIEKIY